MFTELSTYILCQMFNMYQRVIFVERARESILSFGSVVSGLFYSRFIYQGYFNMSNSDSKVRLNFNN